MEFLSRTPAETEALGEAWAREARPGWVIALSGDLGAGKTQLVRGLARGLGITTRVHSPTFTLVNEYSGGHLRLFHLDLYRLETPEQIHGAGLDEYLQPDGVAVIEWAERLFGKGNSTFNLQPSPPNLETSTSGNPQSKPKSSVAVRRVYLEVLSETERRITYEDSRV